MNNWYVVTGGPSVGKTTLLTELKKLGHVTLPEAARTVIDEEIAAGKALSEIRSNEKLFQLKVLKHKIKMERQQPTDLITFFDRGMHDTIAYFKLQGFNLEKNTLEIMKGSVYKKVFLLDPLDIYTLDYARTETAAEALKLNDLLYDAYLTYGMQPIRVPFLPPKERAKFVMHHI